MSKNNEELKQKEMMKVLGYLEHYANENANEIGKRCGMSPQKVARIISRLEKEKIIWGYSAVTDGTFRKLKHFIVLVKRNSEPFDESIKKEIAMEKIDSILSCEAMLESMFFTNGSYDLVMTFYAPDILAAKDFAQQIYRRVGKYFGEHLLLETLLPIRKNGLKNHQTEEIIKYL